jgi:hypothetical protein
MSLFHGCLRQIMDILRCRSRRVGVLLAAGALDLLINLVLLALFPRLLMFHQAAAQLETVEPAPSIPVFSTPFRPLLPTPASSTPPTLTVQPAPSPTPSSLFYAIDFNPGAATIRIIIHPPTRQINGGRMIVVEVNPGRTCRYQDHRACIGAFRDSQNRNTIFATVHSGIGGEAESYRNAVEGTGLDQAVFSLAKIQTTLQQLEGAEVLLRQGDVVMEGLQLRTAVRIPAGRVRDYLDAPVAKSLELAVEINPNLPDSLIPDLPLLVFETCGWKHPAEPWAAGMTGTSGSIYVAAIQLKE